MANLFGGGAQSASAPPPPMPVLAQPAPMPVPDKDQERKDGLKQIAMAQAGKTTRRDTIIGNDDSLG